MAKAPSLTDLTSQYSTQSVINANNQAIEDAFQNTVSRDGSTPNTMLADLDMNSNDILNVDTIDILTDINFAGESLATSLQAALDAADDAAASASSANTSAISAGTNANNAALSAGSAAASASAAAASVVQANPYTNRAAFIAATIPATVTRASWKTSFGTLFVLRESGGPIVGVDGGEWIPDVAFHDGAYPDHFGENSNPGTTDMQPATQALVDWADSYTPSTGITTGVGFNVKFGPSTYQYGSTVEVPSTSDGIRFVGMGKGPIIRMSVADSIFDCGDQVYFSGGDTASGTPVYKILFEDLTFVNGSNTANAVAIRMGRTPSSCINRCYFLGFDIAIDGFRFNQSVVTNCHFNIGNRTANATAFIRLQGVWDSLNSHTPGGGLWLSNNEFVGTSSPSLQQNGILVHTVDGLYLMGNHFQFCLNSLHLEPLDTIQNNKITDVRCVNCYFDDPLLGGRNVLMDGTISSGGSSGNGLYQNVNFTGCLFRGAELANNGILISVTDGGGFVTARGEIRDIEVNGGQFRQHRSSAILSNGAASSKINAEIIVTGVAFDDSNVAGTANYSYISAEPTRLIVTGCKFGVERNAPTDSAVFANLSNTQGTTPTLVLTGNDFSTSIAPNAYRYSTASSAKISTANNLKNGEMVQENINIAAETQNFDPTVVWYRDLNVNNTIMEVITRTTGYSTNSTDDYLSEETRSVYRRNNSGVCSELARNNIRYTTSYPVTNGKGAFTTLLNGTAWASTTAYVVGNVVTSSGNVYLCITAGTSSGTGPTHTSGAALDNTVRWLYLGGVDNNRIVHVVSGFSGVNMKWSGRIEVNEVGT